jgi:nitrite reductase (NADH) small subunit
MLASPIYKQRFDLRSGTCFDDPTVSLPVFPVTITSGRVQVQIP